MTLLWIVVGHETDTTAADVGILGNHFLHDGGHLVGLVKVLHNFVHTIECRGSNIGECPFHIAVGRAQITLVEVCLFHRQEVFGHRVNEIRGQHHYQELCNGYPSRQSFGERAYLLFLHHDVLLFEVYRILMANIVRSSLCSASPTKP